MKYIEDIQNDIDDLILSFIKKSERVKAEDLGLDSLAGATLYVFPDGIGSPTKGVKDLIKYGGFDSVDKSNIVSYGNYTFYSSSDSKVNDCLEFYFNENPQEEEPIEESIDLKEEEKEEDFNVNDKYFMDKEDLDYKYSNDDEDEEEIDENLIRELIKDELLNLLK